jgi:hypothetical protein
MVPGLKAVTLRGVMAAAHNAGRAVQKPRKKRRGIKERAGSVQSNYRDNRLFQNCKLSREVEFFASFNRVE